MNRDHVVSPSSRGSVTSVSHSMNMATAITTNWNVEGAKRYNYFQRFKSSISIAAHLLLGLPKNLNANWLQSG
jgi:hypothetical protein